MAASSPSIASLLSGFLAGALAGAVAALLDWILLVVGEGGGGGRDLAAAACFALFTAGLVGGTGGALIAFLGEGFGWVRRALGRPGGRRSPNRVLPRHCFAIVLGIGGWVLIRFGYLPHWFRLGGAFPPPGTLWLNLLLLGVSLLPLVLVALWSIRRSRRAAGSEVSPVRPPAIGRTALLGVGLLLCWVGWHVPSPHRQDPGLDRRLVVGEDPGGEGGATPPEGIAPGRPNIVLLLVDTLRADALSCQGEAERLTPHLDNLSRRSVQFVEARAQASWTKPSIATLFTSTLPPIHRARRRLDRLGLALPTLAEVLRRGGYRTGAVVANGNISPHFGFQRGFEDFFYLKPDFVLGASGKILRLGLYRIASAAWHRLFSWRREHRHFKRDAREVNEVVRRWLDAEPTGRRRPFFLFVNYVDPHDPYFRHPYNGRAIGAVDGKAPSRSRRREMEELYRGEVSYVDRQIALLLADLRLLGILQRTILVVTADHGEEFLDHQGWWHGLTLYEEQLRVPLLLRLPGGENGGVRVSRQAGLIDLAPTLIALAGLQRLRPPTMSGSDLTPWLGSGGLPAEGGTLAVVSEEDLDGNRLAGVIEGKWKYLCSNPENPRGLPGEELFDLHADPGERRNLAQEQPEVARALSTRLRALLEPQRAAAPAGAGEIDEETEEHLRALGYLE